MFLQSKRMQRLEDDSGHFCGVDRPFHPGVKPPLISPPQDPAPCRRAPVIAASNEPASVPSPSVGSENRSTPPGRAPRFADRSHTAQSLKPLSRQHKKRWVYHAKACWPLDDLLASRGKFICPTMTLGHHLRRHGAGALVILVVQANFGPRQPGYHGRWTAQDECNGGSWPSTGSAGSVFQFKRRWPGLSCKDFRC